MRAQCFAHLSLFWSCRGRLPPLLAQFDLCPNAFPTRFGYFLGRAGATDLSQPRRHRVLKNCPMHVESTHKDLICSLKVLPPLQSQLHLCSNVLPTRVGYFPEGPEQTTTASLEQTTCLRIVQRTSAPLTII